MQTPEFTQPPTSPASVPGIPASAGQPTMSQEEMMNNLKNLMSSIDNKYQDFNSSKSMSDSNVMQDKSQSLREVFDLLQSAGVDPSNVEEVQSFLNKIKENNPELYQQIEKALQSIMGGEVDPGASVDTGEVSQDPNAISDPNMNINNSNDTSQQNI